MEVSWQQALAWRMRRHLLDPVVDVSLTDVVDRLCGVQTQVASSAELATRLRRKTSKPGEVDEGLREGRLIKTWAMRGALHLLTPRLAGAYLALMASGRSWERPSWQRYFGMSPAQVETLRQLVREALDGSVLTREELVDEVSSSPELNHAGESLRSGWGTVLKPLAWQGDLCFGPNRGNRVTFTLPEAASSGWAGLLPIEEAAPIAITGYLRAHGPATFEAFGRWLAGGYFGKRQLRDWFTGLGDRLVEIMVGGEPAYLVADDVDDLAATKPTDTLRLLGGFDQYVLGPGTADSHVVPAERRAEVSRQSGWISPIVVHGGVVSGTWEAAPEALRVAWFGEAGPPPVELLEAETARLGSILDRELQLTVERV